MTEESAYFEGTRFARAFGMAMKVLDEQVLSRRANPYAAICSSYSAFDGTRLIRPQSASQKPSALEEFVHDSFRGLVLNPKFACVAAKSALKNLDYRVGLYAEMPTTSESDAAEALAHDLFEFVVEQPSFDGFSTFVASFCEPKVEDEAGFEARLWQTLQILHELDVRPWDRTVSMDPTSPEFSFSFGGRAFYVVGLHPAASRFTRRFAFPTLVFNAHAQFEALRREGKFERVQDVIRARDVALQGAPNPSLAAFGERSEAMQYAGREVDAAWKCPFHARLKK